MESITPTPKAVISIATAFEMLDVSRAHGYERYVNTGRLRTFKSGRSRKTTPAAVQELIRDLECEERDARSGAAA